MELDPIRQVGRRFALNLERVTHLLAVHKAVEGITDLRPEYHSDILRSAVVLLHAALEDLLRELVRVKSLLDPKDIYNVLEFPSSTDSNKVVQKIAVGDLDKYRELTVRQLIDQCVSGYLGKLSINHQADITATAKLAGLTPGDYASFYGEVSAAIARRHKIVHEGDRVSRTTKSHGKRNHLPEADVQRWLFSVREMGKLMLKNSAAVQSSK